MKNKENIFFWLFAFLLGAFGGFSGVALTALAIDSIQLHNRPWWEPVGVLFTGLAVVAALSSHWLADQFRKKSEKKEAVRYVETEVLAELRGMLKAWEENKRRSRANAAEIKSRIQEDFAWISQANFGKIAMHDEKLAENLVSAKRGLAVLLIKFLDYDGNESSFDFFYEKEINKIKECIQIIN